MQATTRRPARHSGCCWRSVAQVRNWELVRLFWEVLTFLLTPNTVYPRANALRATALTLYGDLLLHIRSYEAANKAFADAHATFAGRRALLPADNIYIHWLPAFIKVKLRVAQGLQRTHPKQAVQMCSQATTLLRNRLMVRRFAVVCRLACSC